MNYNDKKIAILGYGIEGKDAEKFLKANGAVTTVLDQKDDINYLSNLDRYDLIVRSPGVRYFNNSLNITTSTNIFFEEFKGKIIGVTGTKGKGTTSTLIYEILKASGFDVYLAGNIGKPILELLPILKADSIVVLEMSSFQLIDLKKSPHIAVVLNVTSDHMDWHINQKEYLCAKKNIVKFQSSSDYAVINEEYESSKNFEKETKAKIIYFSKKALEKKYKVDLTIRGVHNLENIAASVAVADILNVEDDLILKVVKNFKGLEHRLEFVREVNGIKFYNDSFATGPQPTIAAIKSFTEEETLILGGSDKGLDYKELGNIINKSKNVKNIILIGTTGPKIYKYIKNNLKLKVKNLKFATMNKIVDTAYKISKFGDVVVLSSASASFDMFKDYKDRGNQFKEAVNSL